MPRRRAEGDNTPRGVRRRERADGTAAFDGNNRGVHGPAHDRCDLAEMDRDRLEAAFTAGGRAAAVELQAFLLRARFAVTAANRPGATGHKHVVRTRNSFQLSVPLPSGRSHRTSHTSLDAALRDRNETVEAANGMAALRELLDHDEVVLSIMRVYRAGRWEGREDAPDPGSTFWARVAGADGGLGAARAWLLRGGPPPLPHQLRSAEFDAAARRGAEAWLAERRRRVAVRHAALLRLHKRAQPEAEDEEEQQQQGQQQQGRGRPAAKKRSGAAASGEAAVAALRRLGHDDHADTVEAMLEEEAAADAAAAEEAAAEERIEQLGQQLMAAALPPALAKGLAALDVFNWPRKVTVEEAVHAGEALIDAMLAHRAPRLAEAVVQYGPELVFAVLDGGPRPRRALDALHHALVAAGARTRAAA